MVTMSNKNIATAIVPVTDVNGNALTYALDNLGNRFCKEVKDPMDVPQVISRSFGALDRVQQATGAAQ